MTSRFELSAQCATVRTEHDVHGFVTRTCFKTGPPGRVGIESEWFVHDVADRGRKLEAGMIVTDEPGLYVRPADVKANPAYTSLPANERAGIDAARSGRSNGGVDLVPEMQALLRTLG